MLETDFHHRLQKKEWFLSEGAQAPLTALLGTVSGLGVGFATDIVDYKRTHQNEKLMKRGSSKSTFTQAKGEKTDMTSPTPEGAALGAVMTADTIQTRSQSPGKGLARQRTFQRNKYDSAGGTLAANLAAHAGRGQYSFLTSRLAKY